MTPQVKSATIRYEDGSFLSIRPNDDETLDGTYYSPLDEDGDRRIIARMPRVPGLWGALIGVAAMANYREDPE